MVMMAQSTTRTRSSPLTKTGSSLICTLLMVALTSLLFDKAQGTCTFAKTWSGRWFQSGVPILLQINETHIETKGECYESEGDKFLLYDKSENCYRCMVIHKKHSSVLQYKETYCETKASLQQICDGITGDAALYSMFRKYPEVKPIACPFKSAPFTFSYSRGAGECTYPQSKAESCTDDSRLVLKYQACPDIATSESNVEELVCLAIWKEGSTRYLIGKILQSNRRRLTTDEDQYRCFIYQRTMDQGQVVYNIAQSGDATCNGIQNAVEGSKTMKLTTVDNHHNKCKFPIWITEHHTWFSLDHRKTYKFSQRNATLKILDEETKPVKTNQNLAALYSFQEIGLQSEDQKKQNNEMRVICHGILESVEHKKIQIVAHVTAGCDSGYVCMFFYKRDSNVIEIQQSEEYEENPDEACKYFDTRTTNFTTLITTTLHPKKCPHLGRFTLANNHLQYASERRRKRQQPVSMDNANIGVEITQECLSQNYESLTVGCSGSVEVMEFKTGCIQQPVHGYTCHGSWQENGTHYVITSPIARKSTDALRYCFIYTINAPNQAQSAIDGAYGHQNNHKNSNSNNNNFVVNHGPALMKLSGVSESCRRDIVPGTGGRWSFNFTSNGTCAETSSTSKSQIIYPAAFVVVVALLTTCIIVR